jgi:hypothetical protein
VCKEHIALRWATPRELEQLPLAPTDRHYLNFRLAKKMVL